MFLQFIGTGAGVPSKARNVSALALKLLDEINEVWLFDCGEATQHAILKTTLKPRKISKIFITHLHGDHIFGLPGFLSSRAFQGGTEALTIYGPKGIKDFVFTTLKISNSHLKYPLHIIELDDEGLVFETDKFSVYYRTLKHGVKCYGYKIIEKDYVGELQVDQLKALRIPSGPLYGQLKKGMTVTLEDGRILNGKDFIGPSKKGRQLAVFGDTRYHSDFADFAKGVDVIVYESTFGKGEEQMARDYYHSTCTQAAELARRSQAKQLYLTHISSRYLFEESKQLEKDAKSIFPDTLMTYDLFEAEVPFYD